MTFRNKFLVFLILLHGVEAMLAAVVLYHHRYWFLASEGLILLSIICSLYFFNTFSRPLKLLHSGVESLKDKDFSMRLRKVGQKELDTLIGVYNQMIDQLRHERTLQQEQHFFLEKLVQASPTGILILDPDEKIRTLNPAAAEFLGIQALEIQSLKISDFQDHPLMKEIIRLPVNETITLSDAGIKKYKIHKSSFVNQGFRNLFLVIEELTDEFYQVERSAYEKVIRTISHEFNNSIGPINSILESIQAHFSKTEFTDMADFTNAIEVAIQRNNSLNGFIKRYARIFKLPEPICEQCDIHELILRMEQAIHFKLAQRNISLSITPPPEPLIKQIDVNQFELVFTNILQNAMEAIGADGQIDISLACIAPQVKIRNNGDPIASEIQQQLFTPFFTTKKTGQGVGLTLIREILQNHQAQFSLKTQPDGWTEFSITF